MSGLHRVSSAVVGWLGRLLGQRRVKDAPKVVPLTMHDVAEQRRAVYGDTDRTPCSCPVCRRARNEAA